MFVAPPDDSLCKDVLALCDCLKSISTCLTYNTCAQFEHDMYGVVNPEEAAALIVTNLLAEAGSVVSLSLAPQYSSKRQQPLAM